jgi:hypothetical protein
MAEFYEHGDQHDRQTDRVEQANEKSKKSQQFHGSALQSVEDGPADVVADLLGPFAHGRTPRLFVDSIFVESRERCAEVAEEPLARLHAVLPRLSRPFQLHLETSFYRNRAITIS